MRKYNDPDMAPQDPNDLTGPPPTYEEASEAGSDNVHHFVAAQQDSKEAKPPPVPPKSIESHEQQASPEDSSTAAKPQNSLDEKKQPLPEPEKAPLLSSEPPSTTSSGIPLSFNFAWTRPWTDYPTLKIAPSAPLPSHEPKTPPTAQWRLNYQKKYFARLHRYDDSGSKGDFPMRQVAEIKYPEFKVASGGPVITFEPHEAEIERRGARHVSRTQRMMVCSGWWSSRYAMDLVGPRAAAVEWRVVREREEDVEAGTAPAAAAREGPKTPEQVFEYAKKLVTDDSWTPFPGQELVEQSSGNVLARYTRFAPWAKSTGKLELTQPDNVEITPEYVEGLVIATAAMVGMQDRSGLAAGLVEASAESYMASRARNRNKACNGEAREVDGRLPLEPVQKEGRTERPEKS